MAGALQAYLPGFGHLNNLVVRLATGFGGLAIALPDLTLAWAQGPENLFHFGLGSALVVCALGYAWRGLRPAEA